MEHEAKEAGRKRVAPIGLAAIAGCGWVVAGVMLAKPGAERDPEPPEPAPTLTVERAVEIRAEIDEFVLCWATCLQRYERQLSEMAGNVDPGLDAAASTLYRGLWFDFRRIDIVENPTPPWRGSPVLDASVNAAWPECSKIALMRAAGRCADAAVETMRRVAAGRLDYEPMGQLTYIMSEDCRKARECFVDEMSPEDAEAVRQRTPTETEEWFEHMVLQGFTWWLNQGWRDQNGVPIRPESGQAATAP